MMCYSIIIYVLPLVVNKLSITLLRFFPSNSPFFASDSAEKLIMTVVSRGLAVTPLEKLEINLSLQVLLQ